MGNPILETAPASSSRQADILRAKEIKEGAQASLDEVVELSKRLTRRRLYSHCRHMLAVLLQACNNNDDDPCHRLALVQYYALCCSEDPGLRSQQELGRALKLLHQAVDLANTNDAKSLAVAGALHKRAWELKADKSHLERALDYYLRSYEHGASKHRAYAGNNAAFLLDVLAYSADRAAARPDGSSPLDAQHQDKARHIREDIALTLTELAQQPDRQYLSHNWRFVTQVAEAFFGLKRYDEAQHWLEIAASLHVPEREIEATARHLAMMARMQEGDSVRAVAQSPAWRALRPLVGSDVLALQAATLGKVGLALSGGGLRAALFHVGVLARLAELDALRSIEVISCVSGGSIVAAHYYLEVRKLLQEKYDDEITRDDYIAIVQRLERDLLAGIQHNIRWRVAAEAPTLLRVIFDRDYSRTARAGELYEEEIYARVDDDKVRCLRDLKIKPRGGPEPFHPREHNWRRRAKVPMLILNATSLNTGHNWQFTTSWMGEPPSGIPREVDSNERLRRLYYEQAPPPHNAISLGKAVAASACVPFVFEPVTLSGLYPHRTLRLVDGGVHDNQGLGGLLDEHCKVILVSDASGQMETEFDPGTDAFSVLARADSITRVHVRASQFDGLNTRYRTALVNHLMFLHLKKGLDVPLVNWIGCEDCAQTPGQHDIEAELPYGIPKKVQERLAAVRTDLDTFCDQEAAALMLSGYHMTKHEFPRRIEGHAAEAAPAEWGFLALEPGMLEKEEPDRTKLQKVLDVARFVSFKIWRTAPAVQSTFMLLTGLVLVISWLIVRETGALIGNWHTLAVVTAFCACYGLARYLIRCRPNTASPIPEIVGFLLLTTTLLAWSEILWYLRVGWQWVTGSAAQTGILAWSLAVVSMAAGLLLVVAVTFVMVLIITKLLRARKSWSEIAIGLGFLLFLPFANLHLLTYDRWYLQRGALPRRDKQGFGLGVRG